MKKISICVVVLISLCIQSCLIPSVHSLYSDEYAIQNDDIIGKWSNGHGEGEKDYQAWTFEKDGDKYYLTHDDGNIAYFEIGLIQLGDDFFIDFYPVDVDRSFNSKINGQSEKTLNELLSVHLLQVHTFAKLEIEKESLKIRMFDSEWLGDLLKQRKIKIKHEQIDDDIFLITANTEELQKFVKKYADLKEAYIDYDDPLVLSPTKE